MGCGGASFDRRMEGTSSGKEGQKDEMHGKPPKKSEVSFICSAGKELSRERQWAEHVLLKLLIPTGREGHPHNHKPGTGGTGQGWAPLPPTSCP